MQDEVNNDFGLNKNKQNNIPMKQMQIKVCQASSKETSNPENLLDDFTWLMGDQKAWHNALTATLRN